MNKFKSPLEALKHHVTGAIERGEAKAISAVVTRVIYDLDLGWCVADEDSIIVEGFCTEQDARDWLAENMEAS